MDYNDMSAVIPTGRLRVNNVIIGNTYRVQQGDNLYKIARRLYGNGERWSDLWDKNRGLLEHPCLLEAGMVLNV